MAPVSEIKDLWLIGGAAAIVGIVLLALIFLVGKTGLKVAPPVQEQLQSHINEQHKFIVQMNSDHREERKETLAMIQSLDAGLKANTDAVKSLAAAVQKPQIIQLRGVKPRERKPHEDLSTAPTRPVRPDLWPAMHARYGAVHIPADFKRSGSIAGIYEPSAV